MPPRPPPPAEIVELNTRAFQHHFSMAQVIKRAGVSPASWTRWRAGLFKPSQELLDRLHAALNDMIAEQD